jgi:DNA modification methylase
MALEIVYRPLADLVPYARNARVHSPSQVKQLQSSLIEFGWTNPMLVADNTMIAGHGRLAAATGLHASGATIPGNVDPACGPTIDLSHLSATQRRAYILADNRLAEEATWDSALLRIELTDLKATDFDLSLTGFDAPEISLLLASGDREADPEETPPVEVLAVSRLGDVWILGTHRLVCGDSTDGAVVERALAGAKPHLMVTDPPYGVSYDPNWRNEADRANGKPYGASAVGLVSNDDRADWRAAWALFRGDVAYVWCASLQSHQVADSLIASGFALRSQIIWAKSVLAISRGHYHWQHEPCWYAVCEGGTGHWSGDRKQSTVWSIDKPQKSETGHSTQKPIECMKRPIENNSAPGDHVYEPFSGSGTTIIAAEMTARIAHAIELNPLYVDVAIRRWEAFTGQKARHETEGLSFAEVATSRLTTQPIAAE